MKFILRCGNEEWRESIEKETRLHFSKLQKLLKRYSPDLVRVHADIAKHPRKEAYLFSVNLSLPTGNLHATGQGNEVRSSVKISFRELEGQVKKHMALLRKDYEWKRKRPHVKAFA
jgi:ribosome-associated translation inhibitor RaiA